MNQAVEAYKRTVEQSEVAMTQDYYKNQPPFKGSPAYVPFVPTDWETGKAELTTDEVVFKYIELEIGGKNYLAVLTPWTCGNGPGKKYKATEK